MQVLISYTQQLQNRFQEIDSKMMQLLDTSRIMHFQNDPDSGIFIVAPAYYWAEADEKQKILQINLLKAYSEWFEHFNLLMADATPEIRKQIKDVDTFLRKWINQESSWEIPATIQQAKGVFREHTKVFAELLAMIGSASAHEIIVVPDTNALVAAPDPGTYSSSIGRSTFIVVMIPSVLAELDKLKIVHRDADFRNKIESIIRRIKGWRSQGSLLSGITINKTVTIKMIAREPNFRRTLHWLDASNEDDRIIASVLEIQRENPGGVVSIMTRDINLQNKAEMASIPYVEPPAAP
jgi:PIN domain-containing protein